jgi:hypothetical protein
MGLGAVRNEYKTFFILYYSTAKQLSVKMQARHIPVQKPDKLWLPH